ncbi:MAG: AIR carboxylase family protein [Candidatus Altiarchaeota archaeon]
MKKEKAIILMGSKSDLDFSRKIGVFLENFKISYEMRVASAHKTPEKVLDIIKNYEKEKVVYITVAGKSNALSGFVDANSTKPVIACPPYSGEFSGVDIFSSLRMPSGIGSLLLTEPEAAAIATAKIFGLENEEIKKRVFEYQEKKKKEIEEVDKLLVKNGKI